MKLNYYIEKHDMEIILDALECLHQDMKHADESGYADINKRRGYTMDDVDGLFQSLENSGEPTWDCLLYTSPSPRD